MERCETWQRGRIGDILRLVGISARACATASLRMDTRTPTRLRWTLLKICAQDGEGREFHEGMGEYLALLT